MRLLKNKVILLCVSFCDLSYLRDSQNFISGRSHHRIFVEQHADKSTEKSIYFRKRFVDYVKNDLVEICPCEWPFKSNQFVEATTEHPHVGLSVVRLAKAHLGREIVWRPKTCVRHLTLLQFF